MPIFIGKLTPPDTGRDRPEAQYAVVDAKSRADALNAFQRLGVKGSVQVVAGSVDMGSLTKARRTRGVAVIGAEVVQTGEGDEP